MSRLKITIVLVTYKRPDGLNRTLESIFRQTRQADELIVCDDASEDKTEEVVAKWKMRIPKLRYIKNETNLGMPGNLNKGISMASGDLIINMHDADCYFPELLEKAEAILLENENMGLVFWAFTENYLVDRGLQKITNGRDFFRKHYAGQTSSKIWGTCMVRGEAIRKLMPFDERFNAWADVDMWMRICLDWDVGYLSEPLAELFKEEGQFRFWNWEKTLLIQSMFFLNILRHFEGEIQRKALAKQLSVQRILWWRFMLARIKHRERRKLFQGPRYFVKYHRMPELVRLQELLYS